MTEYFDKNGNQIKSGMYIKYDCGEIEKVYETSDGDLGVNASNENHVSFTRSNRELYPLSQFDLSEWEIIDKEDN